MPSPPPPYTPPPDGTSRLMRGIIVSQYNKSSLDFIQRTFSTFPATSNLFSRPLKFANSQVPVVSAGPSSRPPASRRAASTGAILTQASQQTVTGRQSPESAHWESGMPLPPPPPGPPPENRSQSLTRYARRTPEVRAATTTSSALPPPPPPPVRKRHENTLGEIPPTPSDWNPESDDIPGSMELRVDTGRSAEYQSIESDSGIQRTADRELIADSIRERRSRSRAKRGGQEVVQEDQENHNIPSNIMSNPTRPTNLTLATTDSLLQRRLVESSSCQSSPAQPSSPEYTRRPGHERKDLTILTPPYTPSVAAPHKGVLHHVTTPSEQSSNQPAHASDTQLTINESRSGSTNDTNLPQSTDLSKFAQSSLERYQVFIGQEVAAQNDRERLELFASFMVQESRLRRGLYSEAFNTMAGDIMELTRDMWRPLPATAEHETIRSKNQNVSPGSADIMIDLDGSFDTSMTSTAELTPATDTESLVDESQDGEDKRPANPWGDKFKPCLSPIPSMAVSTVPDEESSRGRSASRWWEESVDGFFGTGGRKLERTKQETKYMSLHPQELFLAAQPSPNQSTPTPGTSKQTFQYGPGEYPQEKVGWHEKDSLYTPSNPPSATLLSPRNKAPVGRSTGRSALDVTRLVTLPPPYPRHYPAVNNSHPALSTLRANHRAVADLSSIRELTQAHEATEISRRQSWRTSAGERLRHFRAQTQASINSGKISYNDVGQVELTFRQSEAANVLRQAETQCQDFRQQIHEPLYRMLVEHARSCDDYIDQLTRALDAEAECNQNLLAQTEGDERPELVEQLTLLKWLFESREHIHKELFNLDTALLARESASVLTYYRQNANEIQLRQAECHFEAERQRRQLRYAQEANERYDCLHKTVERHISRGVEIQLSAFWDIAPGLVEVVHKVPDNLHGFEIVVPPNELAENTSYHEFPLQYMYTILVHAKKSAYQFIEAQTNLLCLLHEVHTATEAATLRLQEIERTAAGESASQVQPAMARFKKQKEQELTEDLQGKVHEVEGQWREALGTSIEECIARVRMWLEHTGGWEESLEV
ncbi:hypothetical protein KCU78_g6111, partial [Aureobasidium melanogenum]